SWADKTEAELSHRHDNKYQPSLLDIISTQLVNISQQLANIHNQLGFTLTRVNTIETVLNITSIFPEQADIINNNKYKNPLDDMEEENNEVVTAGFDISKSVVRQQESQVTELQLENSILKNNLSDNYEKLNNALITIAQMQRLLVHHEILPENRLINIAELIKPEPSDYFNDNKLRIINAYISSSDITLRNKTYVAITKLLNQAKLDNMQVILLGDFNAVHSQINNPSNSNKFFEQLDNDNIYNTFDLLFDDANAKFPTFNNKICLTSFRIDHIYCSDRLAIDIYTATVIDVDEDFTDHNIAITSFYISELVPRSNKTSAKKYPLPMTRCLTMIGQILPTKQMHYSLPVSLPIWIKPN
ncbi:7051_t:CDS:2, partial [Funneliformis geosporum]